MITPATCTVTAGQRQELRVERKSGVKKINEWINKWILRVTYEYVLNQNFYKGRQTQHGNQIKMERHAAATFVRSV